MKKKLLCVVLCALLVLSVFGLCGCGKTNGPTIVVYNWGEYMSLGEGGSMNVNKEFTKETGINVEYINYQTNEELYTMLKSGGTQIDIIIPSDYMIGRLISEGMLEKLNFDNIPNYANIDEAFHNADFDPTDEYSVPYLWSVVGMFYNSAYVDEEDVAEQSWDLLWNEKYSGKILMFDNPRDAFMIAQKRLGYSLNSSDPTELQNAYQLLREQKGILQGYVMDQVYSKLATGEAWIAPYYAGDGAVFLEENEDIKYYFPSEGTNYFFDSICIPTCCADKDAAEAYINFLCKPEVSAANSETVGYASPISAAKEFLDEETLNDPMYYPTQEQIDQSEIYLTLPTDATKLMDELWIELKTN